MNINKVRTEIETIAECRAYCKRTHGMGASANLTNKHQLLMMVLKTINVKALFGGIEYDYERDLVCSIILHLEFYPSFCDIEDDAS